MLNFLCLSRLTVEDDIHQLVTEEFPTQMENLDETTSGLFSSVLTKGMSEGRSQDNKNVKKYIVSIYGLLNMPMDKTQWGIHNGQTASLLCPMDVLEGSKEW